MMTFPGQRRTKRLVAAGGTRRATVSALCLVLLIACIPAIVEADPADRVQKALLPAQAEQPADAGRAKQPEKAADQTGQPADALQAQVQAQQPADTAKQAQQPDVDESALRYFAAKGDKARLEAEIARLRALYPNWVPPEDPLAVPVNKDTKLEAMWQLYSEAKFPELRQAIADRQKAEPDWTPPTDLMERLAIGEKRAALVAASDSRRYANVVTIGAATPSLLTCGDVDVLWRVAEAFAKTNRPQRAGDAYGYVLNNCTDTNERRATIQKASSLLTYQQMEPLLSLEKTLPDGTLEFESIRDDLARRFVAEGIKVGGPVVAPAYLQRLEQKVQTEGSASDASLLGWYYIRHNDMAAAEPYFRQAREKQDSAQVSQGLALTLIARNEPEEAENVMYRWRETSDDARATYFAATTNVLSLDPLPVLQETVLRRMAAAATQHKQIKTAEQFGWYALSFRQPRTAALWFRTTLGWKADYEPAAYGLALARLRLNDLAGVRQIQRVWAGRSQRIAQLFEGRREKQIEDIPSPDGTPVNEESETTENAGRQTAERETADRERAAEPSRPVAGVEAEDNAYEEAPAAEPERRPVRKTQRVVVVRRAPTASPQTGCRVETVGVTTASPEASLARGWCLMQLNRPLAAVGAFETALGGASSKTREDAAYGQSLAYLRLGLFNDAAVSATKARQNLARTVELQKAILSARAVNAFNQNRNRETILYLDQLAQIETERADLMIIRAYAYRKLNRRGEALRIFEALAATGNRDAIRGLGEMQKEGMPKR